jgi:hypothetical protein
VLEGKGHIGGTILTLGSHFQKNRLEQNAELIWKLVMAVEEPRILNGAGMACFKMLYRQTNGKMASNSVQIKTK